MATDLLYKTAARLSDMGISPEAFSDFLIGRGVDIKQNALRIDELVKIALSADNRVIYREDYHNCRAICHNIDKENKNLTRVIWQPEHLFIGNADTSFIIELCDSGNKAIAELSASAKNAGIPCPALVNDGWISCKISVIEDDLFSSGNKTIFNEAIPLGNEDAFRFTGKTLHLEHYRRYNTDTKQVIRQRLDEFTGYICDITFTGEYTSPQYGMSQYPKYTAILKYYDARLERYAPYKFNDINPVYVWLLPDYTLMICPSDDEGSSLNIECNGNRISHNRDGFPIDDYTYTT